MLVTCPECEAKISDSANSCPQCGFPNPVKSSREYCREIRNELDKHIGKEILGFSSCLLSPWQHKCTENNKKGNNKILKKVSVARKKEILGYPTIGYCVLVTLECAKCGEEKQCTDAESVLLRINPKN